MDPETTARLLDVIENDIVPLTRAGVAKGNKLFGAAILRRDDLSLVVAETNNEIANPLWHGEIHAIKRFYEMADHPDPADCIFLATHEPCSLCLSGITWAGFREFSYLFSHQDSADAFAIPHDIRILRAVYAVPDPDRSAPAEGRDLYNRENEFFTSHALDAGERGERIARTYDELSAVYQASKGAAGIPLA
ncbi:nucleoside deaminase [Microbacterium indicum]|uniref:nucleoside deaminase n=1 Tax=Microbacterium indicum TaxID=358100 RepID=UPI0003F7626F|nr:nucleoside deaminase [Microbacterium indicum]